VKLEASYLQWAKKEETITHAQNLSNQTNTPNAHDSHLITAADGSGN